MVDWNKYDDLILSLQNAEQFDIVDKLKDAQLYVNGMTDGWYDFKKALENIIQTHNNDLTRKQKSIAKNILSILTKTLY